MRTVRFAFAFIILFSPALLAQSGPNSNLACSIAGVVVDSTTGQPLRKAMVTFQRLGSEGQPHATRTDAGGRFDSENLEPGEYTIWVSRDGFLSRGYGQETANGPSKSLTINPGEHKNDLLFRLTPTAVISGRVLDEDGEPLHGATVQAMQVVYANGRKMLNSVMGNGSDDEGDYRLAGLNPGKYFLCVTYTEWNPTEDTSQSYSPVYYPDTLDSNAATPMEVHAGDKLTGIDFTLIQVPAGSIRGQVLGLASNQRMAGVNVTLMRRDSGWVAYQTQTATDAQGSFEIHAVPPGNYLITAQSFEKERPYSARQDIAMGNSDVNGVVLTLGLGSQVAGRVRVEGNTKLNLEGMQVNLQTLDDMPGNAFQAAVTADGAFVLKDLPDGVYAVTLWNMPPECYLKSAHLGSDDVLDNGLTLDQTHSLGSLDLVVSPSAGSIEGIVLKDQGPVPGATVVLVPDASHRAVSRLYSTAGTDSDGRFSLHGIPPGDYSLFAWEKVEDGAYMNPDFLQPYERSGRAVRMEDNSQMKLRLDLLPAGDPKP